MFSVMFHRRPLTDQKYLIRFEFCTKKIEEKNAKAGVSVKMTNCCLTVTRHYYYYYDLRATRVSNDRGAAGGWATIQFGDSAFLHT